MGKSALCNLSGQCSLQLKLLCDSLFWSLFLLSSTSSSSEFCEQAKHGLLLLSTWHIWNIYLSLLPQQSYITSTYKSEKELCRILVKNWGGPPSLSVALPQISHIIQKKGTFLMASHSYSHNVAYIDTHWGLDRAEMNSCHDTVPQSLLSIIPTEARLIPYHRPC